MKSLIVSGLLFVSVVSSSRAADVSLTSTDSMPHFSLQRLSVGLNFGTASMVGLEVRYALTDRWGIRLGGSYLSYHNENLNYKRLVNESSSYVYKIFALKTHLDISHIDLHADYALAWNGKLRAVAGLSYMPNKSYMAGLRLRDSLRLNDAILAPEDVGSGELTLNFASKITPYLGLSVGNLRFFHDKLSIGADLGLFYMGKYANSALTIQPALILKSNEDQATVIEQGLNDQFLYRWYPNLNLRIVYSF